MNGGTLTLTLSFPKGEGNALRTLERAGAFED
jgi:hypothetical protein